MTPGEEAAKILLEIKAVTLNPKKPYKYSSGLLSPIYTDNRLLISYPKFRKKIVTFLTNLIKKIGKPDCVVGTPTAGITFAAWVSEKLDLPMIYVRPKTKEHGKGKKIEGVLKRAQK